MVVKEQKDDKKKNRIHSLRSSDAVLPPDLAEGQPYVGEFLLEGFVHVLLEVRGFDVFNNRSLKNKQTKKKEDVKLSDLLLQLLPQNNHGSTLTWTQTD